MEIQKCNICLLYWHAASNNGGVGRNCKPIGSALRKLGDGYREGFLCLSRDFRV